MVVWSYTSFATVMASVQRAESDEERSGSGISVRAHVLRVEVD